MGLIPNLVDFAPGGTIKSADVDGNFSLIRDTVNTYAAFKDVPTVWTQPQTFNEPVTFVGTTTFTGAAQFNGAATFASTVAAGAVTIGALSLAGGIVGDLPYVDASGGLLARLPIGAAGHLLTVVAGKPAWVAASALPGNIAYRDLANTFTALNRFSASVEVLGSSENFKVASGAASEAGAPFVAFYADGLLGSRGARLGFVTPGDPLFMVSNERAGGVISFSVPGQSQTFQINPPTVYADGEACIDLFVKVGGGAQSFRRVKVGSAYSGGFSDLIPVGARPLYVLG